MVHYENEIHFEFLLVSRVHLHSNNVDCQAISMSLIVIKWNGSKNSILISDEEYAYKIRFFSSSLLVCAEADLYHSSFNLKAPHYTIKYGIDELKKGGLVKSTGIDFTEWMPLFA